MRSSDSSRVSSSFLAEENAFCLGVVLEGRHAELAPEAALFHATERSFEEHAPATVDGKDSRLDGARDAQRPPEVAREERAGEAVGRVVREADGVLFVLEGNDADDRTEDLLPGD